MAFDRINIDLSAKLDWFLALSPTGKAPVLKVRQLSGEEAILFESVVICEYLNEAQGGGDVSRRCIAACTASRLDRIRHPDLHGGLAVPSRQGHGDRQRQAGHAALKFEPTFKVQGEAKYGLRKMTRDHGAFLGEQADFFPGFEPVAGEHVVRERAGDSGMALL
ncbi:hypothetical protein J2X72_004509 [Phyllobacterium sp. 1468]|nr:hypothetical protein [Phyllobacterium sp. 1468]